MSREISGRVWTTSLKPAWHDIAIEEFVNSMKGTATIHAITHDKDSDENGEIVEAHTHFLVEYDTPRKLQTLANLFNVAPNFVEPVKSKKAMLRYLTHMDDGEKYKYPAERVISNSPIAYSDLVLGQSLSDKEIAQYLMDGRGFELLGVVSATKLRTIQSFLSFDRNGKMYEEMRKMNEKLEVATTALTEIHEIAKDFQLGVVKMGEKMIPQIEKIYKLGEAALKRVGKR